MKMNGTSKAVFKLLLDWWALFAAFALKNWRTNTNKLQNGFPRPYPCIPLIKEWILQSFHNWQPHIVLGLGGCMRYLLLAACNDLKLHNMCI